MIWNYQKLRQARARTIPTIRAAARKLDITPEYLSMIENGHKSPSMKLVLKMSALYEADFMGFLEKNERSGA